MEGETNENPALTARNDRGAGTARGRPSEKKCSPSFSANPNARGKAVIPRERFRARRGPKSRPDPRREFATLGAPPTDSLEATAWAHQALSVSMYHVINDPDATEPVRRKEMREIARVMAALVPQNRLFDAERLVRGDMAKMDERTGPELVDAPERAQRTHRAQAPRG